MAVRAGISVDVEIPDDLVTWLEGIRSTKSSGKIGKDKLADDVCRKSIELVGQQANEAGWVTQFSATLDRISQAVSPTAFQSTVNRGRLLASLNVHVL